MENSKIGFLNSVFKFSISTWVNFGLQFISTFVLTRVLLPDVYAIVSLFNSASSTLMSIFCIGLDSGYTRFYNHPPNGDPQPVFVIKLLLISISSIFLAGTIISLFFYKSFSNYFVGKTSQLFSVLLFFCAADMIFLRYSSITFRMSFDAKKYTIQSILNQIVKDIFAVIAVIFNPTATNVIIFYTFGLTALAISFLIIQKSHFIPSKMSLKYQGYGQVIKYSAFSAPVYIVNNVNILLSKTIIRSNIGLGAVGIFSGASAFSAALSVMKGGFGTYWSAYMFKYYDSEQHRIQIVHDIYMIALIIATIGLIGCKDIIYLLLGAKYHASKSFFSLVLLYPVLQMAMETTVYGLSIRYKVHYTLIFYFISAIINLVCSYFLTRRLGLIGAAYASAIAGVFLFTCSTIVAQKFYKSIANPNKTIFGVLILISVSVLGSVLWNKYILYPILILVLVLSIFIYKREFVMLINASVSFLKQFIKKRRNSDKRE